MKHQHPVANNSNYKSDIYQSSSLNNIICTKIHAFLIMAHDDYDLLEKLVKMIDNIQADIYIHIDKKSKELPKLDNKYSNIYFIKRIRINWGGIFSNKM